MDGRKMHFSIFDIMKLNILWLTTCNFFNVDVN